MEIASDVPRPEECSTLLFEYTGHKFDPDRSEELCRKIVEHKWELSEKLGRDVGTRVAGVDFIENFELLKEEIADPERLRLLKSLNAQIVLPAIWETISDSQPPKQIVNKRIILPITAVELARKHAVIPPRTIIFFGPPGTGKTHFVRAIAAVLQWWYIEVSPSDLMIEGSDRLGANLKRLLEKAGDLDHVVIFIDEFEEIAGRRDQATRLDMSITNEFLKQVPLFKHRPRQNLLICATNSIRHLDPALLRPGRFDCIIPVGGLDDLGRRTIFAHYLTDTNTGPVDAEAILARIDHFTPADIEYLFQKVRQLGFEREYATGGDYRITTETFMEVIPEMRPSLTDEGLEEFRQDYDLFSRY
jgi:transitional endoplasmic reticulum ATPase